MIVVDTNVIQYCWVHGQDTELAQAVRRRDPDWHAPALWQSELRNILLAYLRRGLVSRSQAGAIVRAARLGMTDGNHALDDDAVLDTATASGLTAYDAEFVALAKALGARLVTADKAILKACPDVATTMARFVGASPSVN